MEDTLGVLDREISQCQFVLILVLMEDSLGVDTIVGGKEEWKVS